MFQPQGALVSGGMLHFARSLQGPRGSDVDWSLLLLAALLASVLGPALPTWALPCLPRFLIPSWAPAAELWTL